LARASLVAVTVLAVSTVAAWGSTDRHESASTLIVLDRSIGGVSLKELRSSVERQLGRGLVLRSTVDKTAKPTPDRFTEVSYGSGSLLVFYVSATAFPGRVEALETRSGRYRTRSGLGVGSSYTKLISAGGVDCYGGTECQHGYSALNRPGTTFRLDGLRGKVVFIAMTFGH
jgi:hypothetical protein